MPHRGPVVQVRAPQAFPRSQFCVFNFFVRRNWLAGEGDYFLRTKKLKMEFCGCSDTRRAFSRACIAKSAYHKPSLSRRMGAALPLRPCGSATRRRPSRRGPQRPWGHRAGAPPPGERASGGRGPNAGKKGDLISPPGGISSQSTKCRSPFACSRPAFPRCEIKFEARRPECARFYQANWPRQARDGAGPRSARRQKVPSTYQPKYRQAPHTPTPLPAATTQAALPTAVFHCIRDLLWDGLHMSRRRACNDVRAGHRFNSAIASLTV